ncbi:unnamed protein product [Penicillium egyptiacum]|uniref:Enoyl reductase (ER) domain-containing protein n=1 Tax=Penicillium egyptiacum TaxID=1303716 RepID=A0A9W4P0N4_9EURO|nr:unnamed protein product [Penicillium egyptiacum]
MLSINIPKHATPDQYELSEVPSLAVERPTDILIKVHAASINPIDVKKASGATKLVLRDSFPYKIGYDCAGTVVNTGSQVTRFKAGDEVFVRLPECHRGSWSELARSTEEFVALKPKGLTMEDAASIPLTSMTPLQALGVMKAISKEKLFLYLLGVGFSQIPLLQIGCLPCHSGWNWPFRMSASKKYFQSWQSDHHRFHRQSAQGEGVVDEIIDYTKSDPKAVIPPKSVDFIFDTTSSAMAYLSLMRPNGAIVTVSILTSGDVLQNSSVMRRSPDKQDKATVPFPIRISLNAMDRIRVARASRYGVKYSSIFLEPNAIDLDSIRQWVEAGKLSTIVGTRLDFKDIEAVRNASQVVFDGRGGVGKSVIVFV